MMLKPSPIPLGCWLVLTVSLVVASDDTIEVSPAHRDDHGFLVHSVNSPFQANSTQIRVLPPTRWQQGQSYRVIYVLPVEAGLESRYGDGLLEVQKHQLHDELDVIFVAPTFSHLPWYADHPIEREIRQESHFLKVVIPFVERTYPVATQPSDRLLLGFSKSGWGAWSLLLRHPDMFGRAAAWDAPLMMREVGLYGTSGIFATQEHLETYRIADLLRTNANRLQGEKRLILTGYGNFREHHRQTRELLNTSRIPHEYQDGPQRNHDWHSGWVREAAALLME